MSVPNQKLTLIHRSEIPKGNNFISIQSEKFFIAKKRLTPTGFSLYCYFLTLTPDTYGGEINEKNKRKAPFELSSSRIKDVILAEDTRTVENGINDLIKKGYLILERGNLYSFRDTLPEDRSMTVEENEEVNDYAEMIKQSIQNQKTQKVEQLKEIAIARVNEESRKTKWEWED